MTKSIVSAEGPVKAIVSAESDVESQIPRDQWKRPMIVPPTGHRADCSPARTAKGKAKGYCTCCVPYVRMSTLAGTLDDHQGLDEWKRSEMVKGLARKPHLLPKALVADRNELREIKEAAMAASDAETAAENGRTLHKVTDMVDRGLPVPKHLPDNMKAMIAAYVEVMSQFEYLDGEQFVVCDRIKAAGTYDRRLRHKRSGRVVIGDLKTGSDSDRIALKTATQIAGYAAGQWYDLDGGREPHGAERDWGLVIHLPYTEDPERAYCEARWIDLSLGRKAALESIKVRAWRDLSAAQIMPRSLDRGTPWD